jgi:hypothetical protein
VQIVLGRNLWGLADDPATVIDALGQVRAEGFDAVSTPVQLVPDVGALAEAVAEHSLEYLPQVFTFGRTLDDHLAMLADALDRCVAFTPRHVLTQAGPDRWDDSTAVAFLQAAERVAADRGLTLAHETHRGRILHTPWVARRVLAELPDLRVAADLSHWVVATESLGLPNDIIDEVAARALHIDARVGTEEAPQVADPSLDAASRCRVAFETWWERIVTARRDAGQAALSVTPEYGPPPYQPLDPRTGEPFADLAAIVASEGARLRARWS